MWTFDRWCRRARSARGRDPSVRPAAERELREVSGVVYLRNKFGAELDGELRAQREVMTLLRSALDAGEDDVALALIARADDAIPALASLAAQLRRVRAEAARPDRLDGPHRATLENVRAWIDGHLDGRDLAIGCPGEPLEVQLERARARLDAWRRALQAGGGGGPSGAPAVKG